MTAAIAVVGSIAGVGALIYALVGSPNLAEKLRVWRVKRSTSQTSAEPRVVNVGWPELNNAVRKFSENCSQPFDLVVGLAPDGVPIASSIAEAMGSKLTLLEKRYEGVRRTPFFVFDGDSQVRALRRSTTELASIASQVEARRVLVVDGVTTFGNALAAAGDRIRERFPAASLTYFVYAVDEPRLSTANPEVMRSTEFHLKIDNRKLWLEFPWSKSKR